MFSFKASHKGALATATAMVTRVAKNNNNTICLISWNNNSARASHIFVHFVPATTQLPRENT